MMDLTFPLVLALYLAIDPDVQKAIDYGKRFKSEKQFMDKALRSKRIKMAANIPFLSSTTKHLTLVTEMDLISGLAAKAQREFRELTEEEATIKDPGSIVALVDIWDEGNGSYLKSRYIDASPHMVLQIGGITLQPESKRTGPIMPDEIGYSITLQFYFQITPQMVNKLATARLVDADGKENKAEFDMSKALEPAWRKGKPKP